MKWNQKGRMVCAVLFVILVLAMLFSSLWQSRDTKTARYAQEEELFYTATGSAAVTSRDAASSLKEETTETPYEKKDQTTEKKAENKSEKKAEKTTEIKSEKNTEKAAEKKAENKSEKKTAAPAGTAMPQKTAGQKESVAHVTFEIQCTAVMEHKSLWKDGVEEVIPASGVFYSGSPDWKDGDTVYDLLKRICAENDIALDSSYTPLYGSYYVRGIGNLYEFDCGSESGWKYAVNDVVPSVGASSYTVKAGDRIVFFYDDQY